MRKHTLALQLAAAVAIVCFFLLPALYLPGLPAVGEKGPLRHSRLLRRGFVRMANHSRVSAKKMAERARRLKAKLAESAHTRLSAKHIQRLKQLFGKRKLKNNTNASALLAEESAAAADAQDIEDEWEPSEDAMRRQDHTQLMRMFEMLSESAEAEAMQLGLAEQQGPTMPLTQREHDYDADLVGEAPQLMFALRHVGHSVCAHTPQDNRTLAMSLDACAARCLLASREPTGTRSCSHFAWVPQQRRCFIYPYCERKEPYEVKAKIYEKAPVHLREVGEGLCLEHSAELQVLSHRTCNFLEPKQRFLYDVHSRVLRLGIDLSQCVDFFAAFQDFGVWACHDAGNHEFEYNRQGQLCLSSDAGKCVQNATADSFYVQLRFPGEASCFHFGGSFDGKTHMIIHKSCEARREQWWLFERESLSFKHASDASICLNWNSDKGGFDVWKCYQTPKQQFQFDEFRLTYCLRHDLHQCIQAFETVAGHGLQLRLPGTSSCLNFDGQALERSACRVVMDEQRWLFESNTMLFRHSINHSFCLEYSEPSAQFVVANCAPRESNQKFHYASGTDGRKYCIGRDSDSKCVQEATLGAEAQLRLPHAPDCLQFDGRMQLLQHTTCESHRAEQKWVYDLATQVYRYSEDPGLCLDYVPDEEAFSAEPCHDWMEGQQFAQRYLGLFCMRNRAELCVQEASLQLRY